MYTVYVLHSQKDKNLYIGFTTNLKNRLKDHNAGRNKSTKSRRPFSLIFYEVHLSKLDAQRRERYFKTAKGKITIKQVIRNSLKEVITD